SGGGTGSASAAESGRCSSFSAERRLARIRRRASRRSASRASVASLTSSSMRAIRLMRRSSRNPSQATAEDVPVEGEDGLAPPFADVDADAVVVEPRLLRRLCDELQHPLRLVGGKLADLSERRHVPLGNDEQMNIRARVDVPDRDEAIRLRDMLALGEEVAEEAVLRQRGSPAS